MPLKDKTWDVGRVGKVNSLEAVLDDVKVEADGARVPPPKIDISSSPKWAPSPAGTGNGFNEYSSSVGDAEPVKSAGESAVP